MVPFVHTARQIIDFVFRVIPIFFEIPMPSHSLPDRLRFIVTNIGGNGCCHSKPSKKIERRQRKIEMTDFIFGTSSPKASIALFIVNGIASIGAAVLAGQSVATAAAVAACVPIIVPMTNSLVEAGVPIGNDAKNSMATMTSINSLQLSFGMIEFLTGDIVNGFIHMLMAGVGFYVVKVDGIVLLPSYSVSSTVFASVSLLNLIEMILYKGNISGGLALTANFLKLATICHPIFYAASAYLAWNLIDQLRAGLLPAAQPAPDSQGDLNTRVMFEPSQIVQRQPFVGRGFTLNGSAPSE